MNKLKMVLPMLAFVFAIAGAVAGDFLPGISARYKVGANCNSGTTEQENCAVSNQNYTQCTILVGSSHLPAFEVNSNCVTALKQIPQ